MAFLSTRRFPGKKCRFVDEKVERACRICEAAGKSVGMHDDSRERYMLTDSPPAGIFIALIPSQSW